MKDFSKHIESLKSEGRYRSLRTVNSIQGPELIVNGRPAVCLCSNNYLGLAGHPALAEAAAEAAREYGAGSGASRLISGNMELHDRLEKRIAKFKRAEKALVFNSGYHANLGVIPAMAGRGDFIYSDELNHASIIDGTRLARAAVRVYPHRNIAALEKTMSEDRGDCRRLIVTDGVFSMDGDLAPLKELVDLKKRLGASLMIDEAHAIGVIGPGGRGAAAAAGMSDKVDISMGTLGKALGCFGAFVAGSVQTIDYLLNTARSLIFTTGLPPPVIASALAAFDVLESEPERMKRLHDNAAYLRKGLMELGFSVAGDGGTPIIPVIVGGEDRTMEICERLLDMGVFIQGIRPPTVPKGSSRLRVTVMSEHTTEHLDRALDAFRRLS